MTHRLDRYRPLVLALLRVIVGLLFLEHGLMKLFHFPAAQDGLPNPLPPLLVAAGLIETVGGALIAIGLLTRPAAFVTSGMMAVGYFMAHAPRSFWPGINMGDPAILYCFIFLYLTFAGAGPVSVDSTLARKWASDR